MSSSHIGTGTLKPGTARAISGSASAISSIISPTPMPRLDRVAALGQGAGHVGAALEADEIRARQIAPKPFKVIAPGEQTRRAVGCANALQPRAITWLARGDRRSHGRGQG